MPAIVPAALGVASLIMGHKENEAAQQSINTQNQAQQQNSAAQNTRNQQANDIFYGSPAQRNAVSGTTANTQGQQTSSTSGAEPSYDPKDEKSVDAYISWMQQQPGVNPSVKNDPGYWKQKMMADTNAGGLGPDANYVKQKMMTPEGAPAGAAGQGMQGPGGIVGGTLGDYGNIMGRYSNFADTGGFSPADLANIRARALSPQRAIYANAMANLNRQRTLQGGYSPGYSTAVSRMAREQSQGMSDATTGAESNIAQMVQQGKLAGMGGMSGLYGSTPGLATTFGNQALAQGQQQLGQQSSGQNVTGLQQRQQVIGQDNFSRNLGNLANVGGAMVGAMQNRTPSGNNLAKVYGSPATSYTPNMENGVG